MKSLYTKGIQSSRDSYWMGQAAATPAGPMPAVNPWLSLIQAGGAAFGAFEGGEAAEDIRKAAEANRAAAEAARQAAATTQVVATKILGLPATTFWTGAAALGALGIIAAIALSKK